MNNFEITELHAQALEQLLEVLPVGESELKNYLIYFAINARLAISNAKKQCLECS